jgi:hypothetical protein
MASPSSPPKSDSSVPREDVALLLRDGSAIRQPSDALRRAAAHLERLGLISTTGQHYVRCADPQDGDFRFTRNRSCPGKVYLFGGLDEAGHDYRCPECERAVFPHRTSKRRHAELRVALEPDGVHDYVAALVAGAGAAKSLCRGMFRVDLTERTAHLCVADICGDDRYLAREWAQHQPTLYMTIDERTSSERLLAEDWLARITLADAVSGQVDVGARLAEVAQQAPPRSVATVSIPVYRTGPPLIGAERQAAAAQGDPARVEVKRGVAVATPRDDGVYPPRTVVFRNVTHTCELTALEADFLAIALGNVDTDVSVLMHTGNGAVWKEPYTKSKRNKISQMLTRLNTKLLDASPPLRIVFALKRGMSVVSRSEAPAVPSPASVAR